MDKLSKMNGGAFDKAYMNDMVADHKKDIAEFQKEANSGKDPDVKAWASKTLPTLQSHFSMTQDTEQKMTMQPLEQLKLYQARNNRSGGLTSDCAAPFFLSTCGICSRAISYYVCWPEPLATIRYALLWRNRLVPCFVRKLMRPCRRITRRTRHALAPARLEASMRFPVPVLIALAIFAAGSGGLLRMRPYHAGGGEAELVLPDLGQATFLGGDQRPLAADGRAWRFALLACCSA